MPEPSIRILAVDGPSRVLELLGESPSLVLDVVLRQGTRAPWLGEVESSCSGNGVKLRTLSQAEFDKSPDRPEGCRAVFARFRYQEYREVDLLLDEEPTPNSTILALDNITDPGNLGAIIRSAVYFGARDILIPRHNSCTVTGVVAVRSAGGLAQARIHRVTNLARSLEALKTRGYWIIGSVVDRGRPMHQADLTGPTVLVIGSEGKGMRPLVQKACDLLLSLPAPQGLGSLNASTFSGIMLYQRWLSISRTAP